MRCATYFRAEVFPDAGSTLAPSTLDNDGMDALDVVAADVASCRSCPRLVEWREEVAITKRAAFAHQDYWGKGVPGFGDPAARIVIVGLAPAAHGANRTGRMFTGDRSGDWLYRALWRAGLANQPTSTDREDGLELDGAWVTSPVRCAPPGNAPTPQERDTCRPFLEREIALLGEARVFVALGAFGFDSICRVAGALGPPRPKFAHGVEIVTPSGSTVLGSFHVSQQNTFTGRLTEPMLDAVFARAVELAADRPA